MNILIKETVEEDIQKSNKINNIISNLKQNIDNINFVYYQINTEEAGFYYYDSSNLKITFLMYSEKERNAYIAQKNELYLTLNNRYSDFHEMYNSNSNSKQKLKLTFLNMLKSDLNNKTFVGKFTHELNHFFDKKYINDASKRMDIFRYYYDEKYYSNNPLELNSYYQQILYHLKNENLHHLQFKEKMKIFKEIIDNADDGIIKKWFSKLSEKNKRRLIKDIAQYLKYNVD